MWRTAATAFFPLTLSKQACGGAIVESKLTAMLHSSHCCKAGYVIFCSMKYEITSRCSKVGERGQVTIPKDLRTRYGVKAGQEVVFVEHDEGLLIRKVSKEDPLHALLGCVRRKIDVDRYLEDTRGPRWNPRSDQR